MAVVKKLQFNPPWLMGFSILLLAVIIPTFTHMFVWNTTPIKETKEYYVDAPSEKPEKMFKH